MSRKYKVEFRIQESELRSLKLEVGNPYGVALYKPLPVMRELCHPRVT